VEFVFTLQAPGEIVLEPFEAVAGGRIAVTREISVRVQEAAGAPRRSRPVFRWQTPLPPLTVGEAAELRLLLTGWEKGKQGPEAFFKGKAPPNAILEELPPAGPLAGGEFIYPLRIIPLEETGIALESFSFQWEGVSLTVPSIAIRMRPRAAVPPSLEAAPGSVPKSGAAAQVPPKPDILEQPLPFPETRGRVLPFFKVEYEQTVSEVKALWEEGRRAQALAKIRGKERESWAGPGFAALRRGMEQSLGLGFTEDEKWRPKNLPLSLILGLFLFGAAAAILFRFLLSSRFSAGFSAGFSAVTSGKISGYTVRIILAAAAAFALILFVELSGSGGGRAVLEKTAVYKVPEKEGTASAFFGEGQPVRTGISRGEWVYVEAADGRAGWAPAASVIKY
jgi:hypothetical protein